MQTSRFQLGLIAALSLGLGYALAPSAAIGYPAGAAVSSGSNPIVSIGGSVYADETKTLLTAPSDQDLIITDLVLTSFSYVGCKKNHKTELTTSAGAVLGQYETSSSTSRRYYDYDSSPGLSVRHAFQSGLRVPAGESLSVGTIESGEHGDGCGSSTTYGVRYSLSGYHAQP